MCPDDAPFCHPCRDTLLQIRTAAHEPSERERAASGDVFRRAGVERELHATAACTGGHFMC
jgi:hypothetical protein